MPLPARVWRSPATSRAAPGLSSSAALSVALCLALPSSDRDAAAAGELPPRADRAGAHLLARRERLGWRPDGAARPARQPLRRRGRGALIDFATLEIDPVPLALGGWRFVVDDSGERHAHAGSGYNERREECARGLRAARRRIAARSDARAGLAELPEPLAAARAHVLSENERVLEAVDALRARDRERSGELINASHASLRDLYQVSTPAVEATVERLLRAGAAGRGSWAGASAARVLALFGPDGAAPRTRSRSRPGPGAPTSSA